MTQGERKGRFIVLEGVDGCGSTTQTRRVVEQLCAAGHDARSTCEPSDGSVGTLIRAALEKRLTAKNGDPRKLDWATLALLFAADRLDHVNSVIVPALAAGAIVVSDRYTLSSIVYQSVTAPEISDAVSWIASLNRAALIPDLTIVLDVPVDLAAERRRARGGPEELFDALSLQARLAEAYARAKELCPGERIEHISGVGTPEAITTRLLDLISPALR
ncbi:MAG TPA: dTMP kinase [Polyangiaceae bacterium]|nr:dTMP kinase [Polyangiaceae bacterium]